MIIECIQTIQTNSRHKLRLSQAVIRQFRRRSTSLSNRLILGFYSNHNNPCRHNSQILQLVAKPKT